MTRSKRIIQYIIIIAVSFSVITGYLKVSARAINRDFLDVNIWYDNENINSVNLDASSQGYKLTGVFKYFIDEKRNNVYLYFDIIEDSIFSDNHNAKISLKFYDSDFKYEFCVDKDGITDYDGSENELFDVEQNFITTDLKGTYITAIGINNGNLVNLLDLKLNINGHNYSILKNVLIDAREITTEKTTKVITTKAETTAKTTTNKIATTTKNSTLSVKPTKYVATGRNIYTTTENVSTTVVPEQTEKVEIEEEATPRLSETSKRFNVVGYSCIGISLLIISTVLIMTIKNKIHKK